MMFEGIWRGMRLWGRGDGGVLGGISSGQSITASLALKPTSSITVPGKTINRDGEEVEMITKGRHDPCVGNYLWGISDHILQLTWRPSRNGCRPE